MVDVWPLDREALRDLATAMGAPLPNKGLGLWATFKSETVTDWHGTLRIIRAGGSPAWAGVQVCRSGSMHGHGSCERGAVQGVRGMLAAMMEHAMMVSCGVRGKGRRGWD